MANKKIAFFDFDGTITYKDSLLYFLIFSFPFYIIIWKSILFLPTYMRSALGFLDSGSAKEKLFSIFIANMPYSKFEKITMLYSKHYLDRIVNPSAVDRILWHKAQNHEVVVVSASPEAWLSAWCKKYDIDLIGTILEKKDAHMTGMFVGKNCNGYEKKRRINERYNLADYIAIYSYGNSSGDKDMLKLATYSYYKYF